MRRSIKENRVGDSPFISTALDGFLQDMAQMYADIDYSDIMNFESSIQDASDPRIKTLKKLYKRAKEAAEYDDDDEIAEVAVAIEDLVKGDNSLTESQDVECEDEDDCGLGPEDHWGDTRYVAGCCSDCGEDNGDVNTLEYFLKKYGFKDIDYCCDVVNVDPYEEICEECFKTSYLPDLNKACYSEYDDLGTDVRTGEPFNYPETPGPGYDPRM